MIFYKTSCSLYQESWLISRLLPSFYFTFYYIKDNNKNYNDNYDNDKNKKLIIFTKMKNNNSFE